MKDDIRFMPGVKMIEGDDQVREQKCLQDILRVLKSYDCEMMPRIVFEGVTISSMVQIKAKPRVAPLQGTQN